MGGAGVSANDPFSVSGRRHRRLLRRIADLEAKLNLWPPWHFVRTSWYDMEGGGGFEYRLPRGNEKGHE